MENFKNTQVEEQVTAVETADAVEAVEKEKPYSFRTLRADDVFLMFNIISKIGIKEFKSCFEDEDVVKSISKFSNKNNGTDNSNLVAIGITVMLPAVDIILKNISKCKTDLYALLGLVSNMSPDKIAKLDAVVFLEMVIDFFKKPEFPDFFKVVSKLFK